MRRLIVSASLCSFMLMAGESVSHAKEWTKNVTGSWNWADGINWLGGTAPGNPEDETIYFKNGATVLNIALNTGGDQTLKGGMAFTPATVAPGLITFNLQGNRLILDGGTVAMDGGATNSSARNYVSFTNGTVQLGTEDNEASINLDSGTASGLAMVFNGAVLDTVNTKNILVGKEATNLLRVLTLDLSPAVLKSGEREGALVVTGTISVGEHTVNQPTNNRGVTGTIKLGTVSEIEIGDDLILGKNRRTGASASVVTASGTLDVALNADPIALTIGRNLEIGVGDRATGNVLNNAAQKWDLTVGSEGRRGQILIGAKLSAAGTSVVGDTLGTFISGGGTFSAHLTSLDVGRNNLAAGTAVGTLDMGASTLGILDVSGAVTIGSGTNARGTLKLKGGEAKALSVSVGAAMGTPGRSLLSLNETAFETQSLTIGALGDILVTIGESSAGIDITSSSPVSFNIASGGVLNIAFTEQFTSLTWGLRMEGDQVALFESYFGDGRLVASGDYGSQAAIFFQDGYTYFGAIPEPSCVLLLLGGGVAFIAVRRRMKQAA